LLVEQQTTGGGTVMNRIQIDKDHMRAESHSDGAPMAFIFDAPKQTARVVNIDNKTYTEITKSDMEQLRSQLDGAMAQMQEQLKNLPPEQRQRFEQLMRGRGGQTPGPAATAKIEYRKTGSDKAGRWSCTTYDGFRGQEKV